MGKTRTVIIYDLRRKCTNRNDPIQKSRVPCRLVHFVNLGSNVERSGPTGKVTSRRPAEAIISIVKPGEKLRLQQMSDAGTGRSEDSVHRRGLHCIASPAMTERLPISERRQLAGSRSFGSCRSRGGAVRRVAADEIVAHGVYCPPIGGR